MKKFSTSAEALAAFIASHVVCCAPMFVPALFGAAISGVALGAISLTAIAGVYAGSYALYRRKKDQENKSACNDCGCKKPYLKSASFTQASIVSASIALGATFNHFVVHPMLHDHSEHDNYEKHQSFEDIINDPDNMCITRPDDTGIQRFR